MILGDWIRDIAEKINIFKRDANLHVNKANKFTTTCGGCFTVLFLLFIGSYAYSKFLVLYQKQSATITTSSDFSPNPAPLILDDPYFFFSVGVAYNGVFM